MKVKSKLYRLLNRSKNTDSFFIKKIASSGLFDSGFYCESNPEVSEKDALIHYFYRDLSQGQGSKPSALFDDDWYLEMNPDIKNTNINPLCHFILHGDKEGRIPSPFFDKNNFIDEIPRSYKGTSLKFFYENEVSLNLSAHECFDIQFYLEDNPDVKKSGISPYIHFLTFGVFEGRNPNSKTDINSYCYVNNINKDVIHPFLHLITRLNGSDLSQQKNKHIIMGRGKLPDNPNDFKKKSPFYEELECDTSSSNPPNVKALAYYLPQFHPFKENDEWWGKGFTEWTNVTRGQPRFNGHYQPRLPKHLGYYDLRVKEVMLEQVKLAKSAGIYGFCFYYYWFNGKRLMDKPVNMFLENKDIDMPFCILWANENWTRKWDGLENDILIAQDYLEEDDKNLIINIGKHFSDERYIRIDNRPLFFIYRPGIIPNAKETIRKWRALCKEYLNEEPLFYMAQAFDDVDPRKFGMDGAIEFPPHKIAEGLVDVSREEGTIDANFTGHYPSYDELIEASMREEVHDYPLIRGGTPSWDNEARKPANGMGFVGSTPEKFERWISYLKDYALQNPIAKNESFIVINAWNEWAEGAYLEPDVYYGAAYLNATYRAMHNLTKSSGTVKLILVGHDANKHGAQLLTLNIFKTLTQEFGIDVTCILLKGGELLNDYENIGRTYVTNGSLDAFSEVIKYLSATNSYQYAICNTTVTGCCTKVLKEKGIKTISLIHELPTLIEDYGLEKEAADIIENADNIVFPASFVRDAFENVVGDLKGKDIIQPQGIYQNLEKNSNAYQLLRQQLSLNESAKIVVNLGFGDLRKGFDLFVQIAEELTRINKCYNFVWVGDIEPSLKRWILANTSNLKLNVNFHIVPFTKEVSLYLEGADVFALTSREDPFPSVVIESLAMGTPAVGFKNSGGLNDVLIQNFIGGLVPMLDCSAFAKAIDEQINNDTDSLRRKRSIYTEEQYDWKNYVFSLLEFLIPDLKRVSVVVPNYNYEQYISERLVSIFNQNYPIYELIVLDDQSSDKSTSVIESLTELHKRKIDLIINEKNSGSVFKQWDKATQIAKGEFLWIAEADDLAKNDFLSKIMDSDVNFSIAYSDSEQIDESGRSLAQDYRYYYDENMLSLLAKKELIDGKVVIKDGLSIKNQFMNVSSIVYNKEEIKAVFDTYRERIYEFIVAGDWFVYIQLLKEKNAKCKLINESLNIHRRHSKSITRSNYDRQLNEIAKIQELSSMYVDVDKNRQTEYLKDVEVVLRND